MVISGWEENMKERKAVVVVKNMSHMGLIRTSWSCVIGKHLSALKIVQVCLLVFYYETQFYCKAA